MELHGQLNMLENDVVGVVFGIETNFPAVPRPGRFIFKDKVLYVCTEIAGGLPVWVPLTKAMTMVEFTQAQPQLEWTIHHTLNTNSVFVQVYDTDNNWIVPDRINTSVFNQVTVSFNTPTAGIAIIMRGETEGSAQPLIAFNQDFTNSSSWVVTHNLGYNPIVRVIVGTNEVQPQSISYNNLNQLTVTFSSPQTGSIRCI